MPKMTKQSQPQMKKLVIPLIIRKQMYPKYKLTPKPSVPFKKSIYTA